MAILECLPRTMRISVVPLRDTPTMKIASGSGGAPTASRSSRAGVGEAVVTFGFLLLRASVARCGLGHGPPRGLYPVRSRHGAAGGDCGNPHAAHCAHGYEDHPRRRHRHRRRGRAHGCRPLAGHRARWRDRRQRQHRPRLLRGEHAPGVRLDRDAGDPRPSRACLVRWPARRPNRSTRRRGSTGTCSTFPRQRSQPATSTRSTG